MVNKVGVCIALTLRSSLNPVNYFLGDHYTNWVFDFDHMIESLISYVYYPPVQHQNVTSLFISDTEAAKKAPVVFDNQG